MLSDGSCVSLGSCEGSCGGSRSCPSSGLSPCDRLSASSPDSSRVCHSCASSGSSTRACHKSITAQVKIINKSRITAVDWWCGMVNKII